MVVQPPRHHVCLVGGVVLADLMHAQFERDLAVELG
jgi:hypothetical protein